MQIKDEVLTSLGLHPDEVLLAQGTLRPDLIESASALTSAHADTIKTHHNDTQLVRALRDLGKVIEPLRDFHKDEVRQLGTDLGLPAAIVQRHPFPGACNLLFVYSSSLWSNWRLLFRPWFGNSRALRHTAIHM